MNAHCAALSGSQIAMNTILVFILKTKTPRFSLRVSFVWSAFAIVIRASSLLVVHGSGTKSVGYKLDTISAIGNSMNFCSLFFTLNVFAVN